MDSEKTNSTKNVIVGEKRTKKERNRLLPVVIALAAITVLGCGFGIWGVVNGINQGQKIGELEAEISSKNEELATLKGTTVEEVASEGGDEKNTTDNSARSANLSLVQGKQILPAGGSKSGAWAVEATMTLNGTRLYLAQNQNGQNSIKLEYNPAKMNELFGLNLAGGELIQVLEVGNIDTNKVVDVKIGTFGQDVSGKETFLYLMEDGTVQYTPIKEGLRNGRLESKGVISGIENVVRLYNVSGAGASGPIGGGMSVFAQRADGDFYDLNGYL